MRILFVFPRWERFLEAWPELSAIPYARRLDTFRIAPLGLPVLASITPPDVTVELADDFEGQVDFDDRPDLVAITAFTPQASRAYEIADRFRSRGVRVVMGGIHPTVLPEEALLHADAVVAGEAEEAWPRLIADFRAGRMNRLYRPQGLSSLEGAPKPVRSLFASQSLGSLCVLQTGRGCNRSCPACVLPGVQGRHVRMRPVAEVVAEVRNLEYPAFYMAEESIMFRAPKFREWAVRLLDGMAGSGKEFIIASYPFLMEEADEDFLRRMAEAGLRQIYLVFGVDDAGAGAFWRDSGSARAAVEKARRAGISLMGSFALGGDEDGPDVFGRTLDFARESSINLAEFFILTPFPGTPLFSRLESEGRILTRDWAKYNGSHAVFAPRNMSPEDLEKGYVSLWKAFYDRMGDFGSALRFVRGFGRDVFRKASADVDDAAGGGSERSSGNGLCIPGNAGAAIEDET